MKNPDRNDTKSHGHHQRKIKKIYTSWETRVGINGNDRKDSREESESKTEANDVNISGTSLRNESKRHATCCMRSKKVKGHDHLRLLWAW